LGTGLGDRVRESLDALQFSQACDSILSLVRAGNKYIDESAPWKLFKDGQQASVNLILYDVLESVRLAAYLLSPLIPNLSTAIYQQLGFTLDFNQFDTLNTLAPFDRHAQWGLLPVNDQLSKPQPIFAKLELPAEATSS
jgi:methionyl-tRNA synthetase